MKLFISLVEHKAQLTLKEGGEVKGESEFAVENDLAMHLLTEIDALLKTAGVEPVALDSVEYGCKDAGMTTDRIGRAIVDTYNFVLTNK